MYLLIKKFLKLILKLIFAVLIWVGIALVIFNWPVKDKNSKMEFHISFSDIYAESLGLDWRKAYQEILDELKPQKIRIAAYWNQIEKSPGQYDFSRVDWQIEEAQKRNVKVILAFGLKAPRWPECFIPQFYEKNKVLREEALLEYEKILVERYKDKDNIIMWQVENEPFLPFFGDCPEGAVDKELVDKEIMLVKSIDDSRPIILTDSGELSLWYQVAKRGDIFGTTLYRIIYKEPFGYLKYPLGPNFFRIKGFFIKFFAKQNNIIIIELQAEPWAAGWIPHLSVEEQYKSMNPEKFNQIIDYAQKTKFKESYLWGVEWWYWLKETKNNSQMWNEAKKLFILKTSN